MRTRIRNLLLGSVLRALTRGAQWALVTAVLAMAVIGFLHLTRGTAVRHVGGTSSDRPSIAVNEPAFPVIAATATATSLGPGNEVQVLLNGDETYPKLWEDLRSAQHSVTLQVYYRAPGRMADTLRHILIDRAKAGVRVFLLYDAFGTADIPASHRDAFRAAGVLVEPFRPIRLRTLHRAQNRSHVRGIVIDSRIGWTGGFGIDDKWFGDGRTNGSWRETNVRFQGPAVRQLQAGFVAAWAEATGALLTADATLPSPEHATVPPQENGATAAVLYSAPTLGSTAAGRFFAVSIAAARRRLYITNAYFAPERNFINLLIAAAQRGVDVRILTAGPRTDMSIVRHAGRYWYEALLAAGVRVFEWQPSMLHAKTFVVDGQWSTIGSMNFDNRSMALNTEATLMIMDSNLGAQMNRVFLDDLRNAREIRIAAFRQRPWWARVAERTAHVVRPLL